MGTPQMLSVRDARRDDPGTDRRGHEGTDVRRDQGLSRELLRAFGRPGWSPPALPGAALAVVQLSRTPDVELPDVVKTLAADESLTGLVLEAVKSPFFAGSRPARTLHQAVSRLGAATLGAIAMEVAVDGAVFQTMPGSDLMEGLRHHSLATAYAARALSRYTGADPEAAFVAGLLHDVGTAGLLVALASTPLRLTPELFLFACDSIHEEVGAEVCARWGLPKDLGDAVATHHAPKTRLAGTVCLAEAFANRFGYPVGPMLDDEDPELAAPDAVPTSRETHTAVALGLDAGHLVLAHRDAGMTLLRLDLEGMG